MRLQLNRGAPFIIAAAAWTAAEGTAAATEAPPHSSPVVARASGETSVYADSDHVTVVTPVATAEIGDRLSVWKVRGQYLVDVISAASVDIVSTASQRWHEVRQEGSLQATYKPGSVGVRASASTSQEPDYSAFAGGGTLLSDLDDKSHLLFLSYSRGHDTIGRSGTPFDVFSRTLDRDTIGAGITLTLNRSATLSLLNEATLERGDPSKPYRYVPMFDPGVAKTIDKGASIDVVNARRRPERPLERLPESRERYAVTARFGNRWAHGTLRVDERVYADSWRLRASTTEVRYFADLSRRWMLWPRLRVHAQTPVYFWRRAYVSTSRQDGVMDVPRYRAGDRELGPLATVGVGVGASFGMGRRDDPASLSLVAQADVSHTRFLDDLYVTSRTATLGMLGLEGVFE